MNKKKFIILLFLLSTIIIVSIFFIKNTEDYSVYFPEELILEFPEESKFCKIDEECEVFGKTGDCHCGCFNKNYSKWKPSNEFCDCMAPNSCKCLDGKCENWD